MWKARNSAAARGPARSRIGGLAGGGVGVEVEGAAVGPPVAGQDGFGDQREVVGEAGADVGEERVEDGAQGEDGRAGVDRAGGAGDGAKLAARGLEAVDHGDVEAGMGEADRGCKAAEAGPDDHHLVPIRPSHRGHSCLGKGLLTDAEGMSSMIYIMHVRN